MGGLKGRVSSFQLKEVDSGQWVVVSKNTRPFDSCPFSHPSLRSGWGTRKKDIWKQ